MLKPLTILVSLIVTIVVSVLWAMENIPTQAENCKKSITFYGNVQYDGLIVDKFIDRHNHMYKTIVIRNNGANGSFFFNGGRENIFEYLALGDSVKKTTGDLFIHINRNGKDTIMEYKFTCN